MAIYGTRGTLFINSQSASHFCRKGQVLDSLLRAGRPLFALLYDTHDLQLCLYSPENQVR